ncbi:DUF6248 family natural product biosynthesis protein [Streptomyces sp. NPDC018019]|uniref:DUF6248 family natural product biosynthesis protein n=1 Tax=Streptomyces sp. NPDC018019 TaxID=3365030 RepID=UPI00378FEE7B
MNHVIRRPQRTLTPQERAMVRNTSALNLQGGLIMGIIDPVPNPSPMGEDEGAWVREQVWPVFFTEIDKKYPFGFWRWSVCERGTCWNCLSGRCELCVHRQEGSPYVDDNVAWVHNTRGQCVAKFIVRPDDAPCVWWCRCPCPKDGSVTVEPAGPVEGEAGPEEPGSGRRPEPGSSRRGSRTRGCQPVDEAQYTLF